MLHRNHLAFTFIIATAATLSACGGGGGDAVVDTTTNTPAGPTDAALPDGLAPGGPTTEGPIITTPPDSRPVGNPPASSVVASGVITQDQFDSMQQLGFVSNAGDEPPFIEGAFENSPAILQASNRVGDENRIGDEFNPALITFTNQSLDGSSVDMLFSDLSNTDADGNGTIDLFRSFDSFVTGSGSLFSAYFVANRIDSDGTEINLIALNGSVTDNGIINLQEAFFDFDTAMGNPGTVGTVIIDGDGFSDRIEDQVVEPPVTPPSVTPPSVALAPLFGAVTIESMFAGSTLVFTDEITFGSDSLSVDEDDGDESLLAINESNLDVSSCSLVATTSQFLCIQRFSNGSVQLNLFSFIEPGRAIGVFEFCSPTIATESCESAAITDRLLNDPDGTIVVTVNSDTQLSTLAAARSSHNSIHSIRAEADALPATQIISQDARMSTDNQQAYTEVMEALSKNL